MINRSVFVTFRGHAGEGKKVVLVLTASDRDVCGNEKYPISKFQISKLNRLGGGIIIDYLWSTLPDPIENMRWEVLLYNNYGSVEMCPVAV